MSFAISSAIRSQPANDFVVDVYPNGYDNGSVGLAVQSAAMTARV